MRRQMMILACVLATATGCAAGSAGRRGDASVSRSAGSAAASATRSSGSPVADAPLVLTGSAAGTTVTVRVGTRIEVRLGSTYWTFPPPRPAGVLTAGPVTARPATGPGRVPGSGAGAVQAHYVAAATGRAVVTAVRRSCGEAMRCTAAQSLFRLTVVVRT